MSPFHQLWSEHRIQYKAYIILSTVILGMTAVVGYSSLAPFERFIGKIDPLLVMAGTVLAGCLLLSLLIENGWGKIYQAGKEGIKWRLIGLTAFFALNSVWIDIFLVFPEDINIPWPASLLFYPAIGFFVEILFHLIPFSILLLLSSFFIQENTLEKSIWPVIIIVALLEPTFQIFFMRDMPIWAQISVWVNLFLFNVFQLYTFKRFHFVWMYVLRLGFYLIWHIIWGVMRLDIFF